MRLIGSYIATHAAANTADVFPMTKLAVRASITALFFVDIFMALLIANGL